MRCQGNFNSRTLTHGRNKTSESRVVDNRAPYVLPEPIIIITILLYLGSSIRQRNTLRYGEY
jgi:hypothetical protein